jgi:hypothetical protein
MIMDKWEYTSIKFETKGLMVGLVEEKPFETELNRLGEQGWELVTCFPTAEVYGKSREVVAVFKRRRREI